MKIIVSLFFDLAIAATLCAFVGADAPPDESPFIFQRAGSITIVGQSGAGVVATDGTYLYAKGWYVYANLPYFLKIGTGANGSIRSKNYGQIGPQVTNSITAFCYGPYLYNPCYGYPKKMEKIDTSTGACEEMTLAVGFVDYTTAKEKSGLYLVTTDSRYVYNVASHINNGSIVKYNGWTVRVYDPQNDWSVIREYSVGTSSFYTVGVLADGAYLYFIESTGTNNARVVCSTISDGQIVKTWTTNQADTMAFSGQYDSVNKKFYIGALRGGANVYEAVVGEIAGVGIPRLIRFQGALGDPDKKPVEDGSFNLTFRLYDRESEGTPLWEETREGITVEDGLLDVELGSKMPLTLAFDKQYYLGVEVESDGEMSPRFKLTSVPYALKSN